MEQKASIGRIVHYVTPEGNHRPAIITGFTRRVPLVGAEFANLRVFFEPEDGLYDVRQAVRYDESASPASWHWPERVD